MSEQERRRGNRVNCCVPIAYRAAEKEEWNKGVALDFSQGGVRIVSLRPLPTGTKLECKIDLGKKFKNVKAMVRWHQDMPDPADLSYAQPGMGLEFTQVEEGLESEIERINLERDIDAHFYRNRIIA